MKHLSERIHIDFRSNEPNYLQIVRQIEDLVRKGVLKSGDQLPTVRALATELRINFSTVARAYHLLDQAEMISTQRGRGTYIWKPPDMEEQASTTQRSLVLMARHFWKDARNLGISDGEILQSLELTREEVVANPEIE